MSPLNDLTGRVALITGASGGIGAAISRGLAKFPLKAMALHYSSSAKAAEDLRDSLVSAFPKLDISIHQADLSQPQQCQKLIDEVLARHGKVDIFVSNAGAARRIVDILDVSLEDFDKTLDTNLRPSFLLTKGFVPAMRTQKWGRIVFVSSIAAHGGGVNGPHYAASKGGLSGLMRNLSTRLAEYNISVNDVAPAMIEETGMIPSDEAIGGYSHKVPLQRLGKPDEVADAVVMFVTCGYITGQSLLIAGGLK